MTHAARQRAYRERHPEYRERERQRLASRVLSQARNPDRLMASEKRKLRATGQDPSNFRVETGRPYLLFTHPGVEEYCTDGYLQGEPCPWGCWGITDG